MGEKIHKDCTEFIPIICIYVCIKILFYSFSHLLLTNPLFALSNWQMLRQTTL